MRHPFERNAGYALIIFTLMMLFTMVLHPPGGSFEHLIELTGMTIITHSVAICSLPFAGIGFWGLTKKLGATRFLSITAFAFIIPGLIAVMLAAAANGIVLPLFINLYRNATPEKIESLKPLMKYNFTVNLAFDYIYTGAFTIAILLWSAAILQTKKMPVWLGWTGIALALVIATGMFAGFTPNHLHVFRMFVAGIIVWVVLTGIQLIKQSNTENAAAD